MQILQHVWLYQNGSLDREMLESHGWTMLNNNEVPSIMVAQHSGMHIFVDDWSEHQGTPLPPMPVWQLKPLHIDHTCVWFSSLHLPRFSKNGWNPGDSEGYCMENQMKLQAKKRGQYHVNLSGSFGPFSAAFCTARPTIVMHSSMIAAQRSSAVRCPYLFIRFFRSEPGGTTCPVILSFFLGLPMRIFFAFTRISRVRRRKPLPTSGFARPR